MNMLFPVGNSALLSPCRTWRYALWRRWGPRNSSVAFIGLNPSKADEIEDDATIRRCIGFARLWGHDSLVMLNLFAFRATYPRDLWKAEDPIGPMNDATIGRYAGLCDLTVAAWGADANGLERVEVVVNSFAIAKVKLHCLGRTAGGAPRHPVRLPYSAQLEEYRL